MRLRPAWAAPFRHTFHLLFILSLARSGAASDWPQWRGPLLNGSTDDATSLPARWIPNGGARWAAPLPGEAGSTPVVMGGRIFLTSTDRKNKNILYAKCLSLAGGKELWSKTIPGLGRTAFYNTEASPSPVAGGGRVVFLFGQGSLFSTDLDGNTLWERNLERDYGPLTNAFIYSASPLLFRDRLYLALVRDEGTSFTEYPVPPVAGRLDPLLLCLDPATGHELWKAVRPADDHGAENLDSYATPVPWESAPGQVSIVTVGANFLTGHDWRDGRLLWSMRYGRPGGYRQRIVPTPVVAGGLLVASRPRRGIVYAVRPGGAGELTSATQIDWQAGKSTPDTPSALYYRGRLYFISDVEKRMTCLDPATGRTIWSGALGGTTMFFASPTGADGKIYCVSLGGEVVVLAAGDKYNIIGRMRMGGYPTNASIVSAGNMLLVRTERRLYCIDSAP